MTKWLGIAIIIVIVLVGGYFLLGQNKYTAPAVTPTPTGSPSVSETATPSGEPSGTMKPEENTITLSETGFTPATLTVKAGTKVAWVNKSGGAATVNSDPHPTHTNYPPLNLGQFADGDSLSLTFDKPGTYGYHNHFNPSQKGTIIVQ